MVFKTCDGYLGLKGKEMINKFYKSVVDTFKTGEGTYAGYLDTLVFAGLEEVTPAQHNYDEYLTKEQTELLFKLVNFKRGSVKRYILVDYFMSDNTLVIGGGHTFAINALGLSRIYSNEEFEVADRFYTEDKKYISVSYVASNGYLGSRNAIKIAKRLIKEKEYDTAYAILYPLERGFDNNAIYLSGVIFEEIGEYRAAMRQYKESELIDSKLSVIRLFDDKYVGFNSNDYLEACNYLIDHGDMHGYTHKAYHYYKYLNDYSTALCVIESGLKQYKNSRTLLKEKKHIMDLINTENLRKVS